jgi:WD40 repeat protein
VGFADPNNKLDKISVEGGAVVSLGEKRAYGTSWGEDGNIIACQLVGHGMVLIPSGGGAAKPVTELANGEVAHAYPQMLPGGKAVLFTAYSSGPEVDKASIQVVSLTDRHRKALVRGGTAAHYVATSTGVGHLVYSHKGTLFAIPFDLNRLETRGSAASIVDGVAYETLTGVAHFDVSRTGTLVYRKAGGGASDRVTTVQWLDAAGKQERLLPKPDTYNDLRLSPDGKRLAVSVGEGSSSDIWVYDPPRDATTRLTFGGGSHLNPTWSPDGRYIVFGTITGGMFWTRADGAGQPQPLTQRPHDEPSSFSPDGKRLAYINRFDTESGLTSWQIWIVAVEDNGGQLKAGKPEQFLKTQFNDVSPMFSPDGHWLAYESNESGKSEVYVRTFLQGAAGQDGKWPISNSGGRLPVWSRKNRELFYQSGDQIMAAKYTVKGDVFVPEKPWVWAAKLAGATEGEGATWFDLAPDGKRLAVEVPVAAPVPPKPEHEVTLVFNFFDELRRRAPVAK